MLAISISFSEVPITSEIFRSDALHIHSLLPPLLVDETPGALSLTALDELVEHIAANPRQRHCIFLPGLSGEYAAIMPILAEVRPNSLAYALLCASPQKITAALLALLCNDRDIPAISLFGHQTTLRSRGIEPCADLLAGADLYVLAAHFERYQVIVLAGFQGIDPLGNIAHLDRSQLSSFAHEFARCVNP